MTALRRPWLWVPLLVVLLFGVAIIAGYTLVPGLVRSQAQGWVATKLKHKMLALGAIRFDPWALALTIDDIALADSAAPAQPLVAIKSLHIDASIASLWTLSPQLDAVTVADPMLDAVLRPDGSLNLVELLPPDDGTPTPAVRIGDLTVTGGKVHFTDARRPAPQRKTLAPVSFELKNFATTATAGGGFTLAARSDDGEGIAWSGTLAMAPFLTSSGRFSITALRLATISRFAGDLLPVVASGGTLDLAGGYRFATPPAAARGAPAATQFDADLTSLAVADVAATARSGDHIAIKAVRLAPTRLSLAGDVLALGDMAIDGISVVRPGGERASVAGVTLAATRYAVKSGVADVGAVAVRDIQVTGRGTGAGTIGLAGFSIEPSQLRPAGQTAAVGVVTLRGLRLAAALDANNQPVIPGLYPLLMPKPVVRSGPAWQVALAGLRVEDAAARITGSSGTARLDLAPAALTLGPLTSALAAPVTIDMTAAINGKGRLAAKGSVSPAAMTADLAIDLAKLPLADLAALGPALPVAVRAGSLDLRGRLTLASGKHGPQAGFAGDAGVAGLNLGERSGGDLLAWRQLAITGIRYQPAPARLAIARISFDRAVSHVVITRERTLNLANVAGTAPDAAPLATPGKLTVAAPISSAGSAVAAVIPVTIGEVRFAGSSIDFSDQSIDPNFSARIDGFSGTVTGLSTRPGTQANFALKGYVIDRFAPVVISGRANPFAYDANTDLTASFSNIDLPVFNPYSGRFAGYAIAKGKLSTVIHYRIVDRKLDADHKLVLDQLTWGEATDSKEKVSLPVRLATSLLKDRNGVIDLDLPVGGTLDDPKFRIWPVIWQVVGNVLTKIITAPFALIGSLFGGGAHPQIVDFAPGSAVLPPDAGEALAALAKGLGERPEVNLDIPAGSGIREDAEAMTTARLQAAVLASPKARGATDYAALAPGDRLAGLAAVYKAKTGKGPDFPKGAVEKAGLFAGGAAKAAAADSQIQWLEQELRAKFTPSDNDLAALGQARAAAVKEALLAEGSIAPTRVFVSTASGVKAKGDSIEMELAVK